MRLLVLAITLILHPVLHPIRTAGQSAPAPVLALKNLRGHSVRLSNYRGKVVLLNFWATWCSPCLAEMPELAKLQKEYRDCGLQIIGIAHPADQPRQIAKVVKRLRINYPILLGTQRATDLYDVSEVLPVTIVVDREGKIRDRILGILDPDEFEQKVRPLLR